MKNLAVAGFRLDRYDRCTQYWRRIEVAHGFHKESLSPRSGRQHKAWGASPRIRSQKQARARETGDSMKFTGFRPLSRAPSFFIGT